jgi:quercetin dioxygenase-like cupin family protein
VIHIEPGTRHRVVSDARLKTIVVAIPPFREDGEHFD